MSATLTRDGSALIVVDMQNAYLHPEGSFARLWPDAARKNPVRLTALDQTDDPVETGRRFDLTLLRGAIPGCKRLIDGAHEAGVPVGTDRLIVNEGPATLFTLIGRPQTPVMSKVLSSILPSRVL
jgi:nicotinamidase-related amidase